MYIKIIVGFREDQFHIIGAEEAHKAYYLFLNPEERAVFSNGVALIGKNIQGIMPAYNETMGWNANHQLNGDDWNDIRKKGVDKKLQKVLHEAKEIAYAALESPAMLNQPLSKLASKILISSGETKKLADKFHVKHD